MTTLPPAKAALSADGKTVMFRRGGWRDQFPVECLPAWIKFYSGLRDRCGGKFAGFYEDDVAALEAVQARVKARAMG